MAEPPPSPEPGDDTRVPPAPGPTGMPRWVKVFLIAMIVLVLALMVSLLLGVQHGPDLHSPPDGSSAQTAPIEQEVAQP